MGQAGQWWRGCSRGGGRDGVRRQPLGCISPIWIEGHELRSWTDEGMEDAGEMGSEGIVDLMNFHRVIPHKLMPKHCLNPHN